MALSYPLTAPTAPAPRRLQVRPAAVVGKTVSPFTGEQQVQAHAGQWWECDVEWPPMSRARAAALIAAFVGLNFREGTLLLRVRPSLPLGVATGVPLVNGASQTGRTLATDGWTNGVTGIVKAGDFFYLGSGAGTHLHQVVQDATSNGSGQASLEIWPALRAAPADNAALTFSNPQGLWRLKDPFSWSIDLAMIFGLSATLIEAI